ncbi:nucleoside-specific outer membrane channel protein Tsx [Litorivivens lipolytica]|uniref:Nucleoside-specific outer membrane channel protein Tsx n=1 Tax=Litorivivens lipolytica TaxID=1524264 RepID=A0A7W4Z7T7_9GAMM|nr:hypothetical protein [Litorivivens lipolytica]MBB3048241.1 nucleoside-specific outer membrane channel protein Tsx [Litorivivens lipolytica]
MRLLLISLIFFGCSPLFANESFIRFHSANVQALYGEGFEPGDDDKHIFTGEYFQANRVGDLFFFIDSSKVRGGDSGFYSELSPRLSLPGFDWNNSKYIKNVLLALNIEKPEGLTPRRLYGFGVDLKLPGFQVFNTHLYQRDDPTLKGNTFQFTLVWKATFSGFGAYWLAEGFADLAGGEGPGRVSHQLVVPRLLLDVGQWLNISRGRLFAGVEYSYWHNKFGLDGVTESVPQLQLKWVMF